VLAGLIALAISITASGLVYYSWRRSGNAWAAAAGWLLAFGSAFAWVRALGAEFGVSYAIIIFTCLVWAAVALNVEATGAAGQSATRPLQAMHWPGARDWGRHGGLFLLSVPVAGVVALMLSVALVLPLPWSLLHKLTAAIFLYPVLWGALSAWICAQDKLARPALVCLGLAAVSALLLFI